MFRALIHRAATLLPSQCAVCRAWPSQPVCGACVARFAQPRLRCSTCALVVPEGVGQCGNCLRQAPPLDACLAAVDYAYPWSQCIARYKFQQHVGWAATLADLLRHSPWVEPALERCDVLLPMPLSAERLRERGFNQSLELARHLAPGKTDARLLLRTRHTAPQPALSRTDRLRNVKGAFALEPLRAHSVRDKRVVLVDDVMTSGASLFGAAAVLRHAGAAHITGLVVARTSVD